jgi:Cdc6-like AAA superfamily ATPase
VLRVICKGGVAQPYAFIRFPACSCREVVRLSPHQKVLLESVYSKEEKQSPTEVYREFNNIMRLNGREQVSHKTLSELTAELELYGYVEVERKGGGRGRRVDFYISPTGSVERNALLDALKDLG